MTPPPAVTDEELAEVERLSALANETATPEEESACAVDRLIMFAPRLVREVRYLRAVSGAWKLLASALILYRGRGNESDVLQAVANLDKLGVKVP